MSKKRLLTEEEKLQELRETCKVAFPDIMMEYENKSNMDYTQYKESYDANLIERWKKGEVELDVDTLRAQLYGFTFTPDYAKGLIEDALCMDYWRERNRKTGFDALFDLPARKPDDFYDDPMDEIEAAVANADPYEVDTPQEHLLMEVLDSTGDGKTPQTAICVIDVHQEYEYLKRKFPYNCLHLDLQSYANGIDSLHFKKNVYGIERIYFNIQRRFEVPVQRQRPDHED